MVDHTCPVMMVAGVWLLAHGRQGRVLPGDEGLGKDAGTEAGSRSEAYMGIAKHGGICAGESPL